MVISSLSEELLLRRLAWRRGGAGSRGRRWWAGRCRRLQRGELSDAALRFDALGRADQQHLTRAAGFSSPRGEISLALLWSSSHCAREIAIPC